MFLFYFLGIHFISAILCIISEFFNVCKSRWIAFYSIIFSFFSLFLLCFNNYDIDHFFTKISNFHRLEYCVPWMKSLGISFHLYLDEFSAFMIFLSLVLGFISVVSEWNSNKKRNKYFISGLMLLLGSIIGIFLSTDLFLFFLFWELSIFLTYFLLVFFGNNKFSLKKRIFYSKKFLIYSQISGFILLFSIISLSVNYFLNKGILTFDFNILKNFDYNDDKYFLLMIGFFLSFIIKFPIIPFHKWIIDFYKISPTSGSLDILGTLLKTSLYGILKFNVFLFPNLSLKFFYFIVFLSFFNMFCSTFFIFKEKNLKKIFMYSSITHISFILLGLYSNFLNICPGILLQIFTSSISFSILFLILGKIFSKKDNYNFIKMSGLWNQLNYIPQFFLFFIVVNIGLPFNGNFLGEFLILFGVFKNHPIIGCLILFNLLFVLLYYLTFFHVIFYGKSKILKKKVKFYLKDYFLCFFSSCLIVFSGFFSKLFIINFF